MEPKQSIVMGFNNSNSINIHILIITACFIYIDFTDNILCMKYKNIMVKWNLNVRAEFIRAEY